MSQQQQIEIAKKVMLGQIASENPDLVPKVLERAKEMQQEFIDNVNSKETDDEKAIEVYALSFYAMDMENTIERLEE